MKIEYDGADFRGWQSQRCKQTVQDTIEQALSKIAGHPLDVCAAGRTDAGVHATLMPAHFQTTMRRPPSAWVHGANAHLPPAARLLWAHPVAADFHARHCAQRRYYQYVLLNRPISPGLLQTAAGHCPFPLDIPAMQRAARYLRGEHDFSSFRAASCQAKKTVRQLYELRIQKNGDWIVFNFCGNGFLHHMVRNIVGALLHIGRRQQPPQWLRTMLAARNRRLLPPTAAAAGLYFSGAHYAAIYRLPTCIAPVPIGRIGVPFSKSYL